MPADGPDAGPEASSGPRPICSRTRSQTGWQTTGSHLRGRTDHPVLGPRNPSGKGTREDPRPGGYGRESSRHRDWREGLDKVVMLETKYVKDGKRHVMTKYGQSRPTTR